MDKEDEAHKMMESAKKLFPFMKTEESITEIPDSANKKKITKITFP